MVKKVAVINDLSGLGKCSLTAAIPVLSVMGVQACPLPTAILTNQTGYDSYYCETLTDKMDYFTEEWKKRNLSLSGIYTGYLGSSEQVEKILSFCETFRKPETLLFVDPVMGDDGKVYDIYTPDLGTQMKYLVTHADVITPNLTECCLLTDTDYQMLMQHQQKEHFISYIEEMARPLLQYGLKTILITGIIYQGKQDAKPQYYNLIIEENGCHTVSCPIYGSSYSGTGDLLASVLCAGMTNGEDAYACVRKGVTFLEAALKDTVAEQIPPTDGLNFEPYLSLLLNK